ncbi:MAG TPA: hypothetical protein VH353_06965 [Caulobacteraceae bacterium]|nr:hypothetical protein [Caulobacteraceae bacterium]
MTPLKCAAAGLAAVLGLAAATAAAAQAADPVFAAFHETCIATGAEPAAVTTATASWKNSDVAGTPISGFAVDAKASKTTRVGDAELKLFAWHGTKGQVQADECQIAVSKTDFTALRSAAAASLGFAAQQDSAEKAVFQFSGGASAPKPVDSSQFDQAASSGGLGLLTISKQGSGAFMELLRIRK